MISGDFQQLRNSAIVVPDNVKLKSMVITFGVMLSNVSDSTKEWTNTLASTQTLDIRNTDLDISQIFGQLPDIFQSYFVQILDKKLALKKSEITAVISVYERYLRLIIRTIDNNIVNHTDEYQQLIKQVRFDTVQLLRSTSQALLIASNGISCAILAAATLIAEVCGKDISQKIIKRTVEKMGEYCVESLHPYIACEGDSPLLLTYKAFLWTFLNGNPEMKINAAFFGDGFSIEQFGECRQWTNANILECHHCLEWPVNLGFFSKAIEAIPGRSTNEVSDLNTQYEITLTSRQCDGDETCRFECSRTTKK